ncbi:MAG TPA: hypothetical protein VNT02_13235 [Burkholderiales bacterium]|nr:hypothetical protein [Burkholderiales bacterium]
MPADTDFAARAVASAKERSQQILDAAQERSRQIADSAQRYMQENPVRAVSYTSAALFGLGIIIGRLLAPDRNEPADLASHAERASQEWTRNAQKQTQQWLDAAKEKSQDLMSTAQQRSRELMNTTQELIEENPARAATIAGIALLALAAAVAYMASGNSDKSES